ncbi:MAG: cytochrome b/b6 domain-containing protein [Burkholderiaceae bacterium]|nr:cytochrome b/b6 domain-containing protein [Burkholderiaceae bacterium]
MSKIRIWDLATRLFHWSLVMLVTAAVVTAQIGGNALEWHFYCGYAILSLLVFRILWGMVGARYARFSSFALKPSAFLSHIRTPKPAAGHTPFGSLSVLIILLVLLAQAVSGLFANDDIASEGPLAKLVAKEVSDRLSWFHAELNSVIIYGLAGLHVAAVAYYFFVKRENLLKPMITGDKEGLDAEVAARDDGRDRLLALVLFALSLAAVSYVVKL